MLRLLLLHIQALQHLLIPLRIIHLQVGEKLPAASDLREKSATSRVVFLVLLQMFRNLINLLGQNTDLYLWRASIFVMRTKFGNELLLRSFLEGHGE